MSPDQNSTDIASRYTGEAMTLFNLNPTRLGLVHLVNCNSEVNTRIDTGYAASFQDASSWTSGAAVFRIDNAPSR